MYLYVYTYIYICVCNCICSGYMYVYIQIHTNVYNTISIYMYVYTYIYIFFLEANIFPHIYIQTYCSACSCYDNRIVAMVFWNTGSEQSLCRTYEHSGLTFLRIITARVSGTVSVLSARLQWGLKNWLLTVDNCVTVLEPTNLSVKISVRKACSTFFFRSNVQWPVLMHKSHHARRT